MKELLQETYNHTKSVTGFDPVNPQGFRALAKSRKGFDSYVKSLSEGLDSKDAEGFKTLAENTRVALLENSMFSLNPYETLTVPILRRFYPKLIAKELVNVMPIDKPEVIKGFMRAYFGRANDQELLNTNGPAYPYQFPYIAPDDRITAGGSTPLVDISRGPSAGINGTAETGANETVHDVLFVLGTTKTESHLEKDFAITGALWNDATTTTILAAPVYADVDGNFSFEVVYDADSTAGTDIITGKVDFLNGILYWSSVKGYTQKLRYTAVASLEENKINPKVKYSIDKIRFQVVQRQISAEWTIPLEQDIKALYDINIQSELVNIIGEQIAAEIDREIIDALIAGNTAFNDQTKHADTFSRTPDDGYTWGPKQWYENIIPKLNTLSAQVYNSTLMDSANTIACNPLDAAILESLNGFAYSGNSVAGGDLGYRVAEVQGGKWKVLVSSIVPAGKMILKYRSSEMQRASFVYSPYIPAILSPFPLGAQPNLTVLTRYASKLIRPEALAVLNITS